MTQNVFITLGRPCFERRLTLQNRTLKKYIGIAVFIFVLLIACPVQAKTVAKIGKKSYSSLGKAIAAVKNQQTIVVTKNTSIKDTIYVKGKKKFTINLNKHTLKTKHTTNPWKTGWINIKKANVTIKNGTMKCGKYAETLFEIEKKGKLTIVNGNYTGVFNNKGQTIVKNGTFKTSANNREIFSNTGKLTINKGTFSTNRDNSNIVYNANKLTIKGGTFSAVGGNCVYVSSNNVYKIVGSTTITGGSFTSKFSKEYNGYTIYAMDANKINVKKANINGELRLIETNMSMTAGTLTGGFREKTYEDSYAIYYDHHPIIYTIKSSVSLGKNVKITNRAKAPNVGSTISEVIDK